MSMITQSCGIKREGSKAVKSHALECQPEAAEVAKALTAKEESRGQVEKSRNTRRTLQGMNQTNTWRTSGKHNEAF